MRRNLTVWTTGFLLGIALTIELLWGEAERALAREHHHRRP